MADLADDSSHYEISLTAGQAFIAFVLLLLSLGAAFAFGVMVGRGQLEDRLVVRTEPTVIDEGKTPGEPGRIVELGVETDDFTSTSSPIPAGTEAPSPASPLDSPVIEELRPPIVEPRTPPVTATQPPAATASPVFAQVLSSGDQKAAETLAAKLIDAGFAGAYVERGTSDRGPIYRVRVRFPSETEARAAADRLRALSGGGEVWITRSGV